MKLEINYKKILMSVFAVMFATCLTACSDSSDDDNNSNEGGAGSPSADVDYRLQLVSALAGTYSGECISYPDERSINSTITLSETGDVTTSGASGSLTGSKVNMVFARKFNQGVVDSVTFNANDTTSDQGVSFEVEAEKFENSNSVMARQGLGLTDGVRCLNSPQAVGLIDKSVYSTVSRYLVATKQTINCVESGRVKELDYELLNDRVLIGDQEFSLVTNLKEETAGVIPSNDFLVYSIKTTDNREFTVSIDPNGSFSAVGFKDNSGDTFACVP